MKKVALIFPGYGSQFVGMGKDLYDDYRIMQEFFEEGYSCQNLNFVKLCFASSDQELSEMVNAFQAIFLLSSALYGLLKELGIKPDVVAGQGVGYYTALFASGAISFPDGLYLLSKLASFYEKILDGAGIELIEISGLDRNELEKIISKFEEGGHDLGIAVYQGKDKFLVGGKLQALEKLKDLLGKIEGVKINSAPKEIGLYSEVMAEVADQLQPYLEKVDFKDTEVPLFIAGKEGFVVSGDQIKEDVIHHLVKPFDWDQVLDELKDYDVIIEVGPRGRLSDMVKRYYPEKEVLTFGNKSDVEKIKNLLGESEEKE
jgi:[acyl-carrier-protein] S-malonyltransferase